MGGMAKNRTPYGLNIIHQCLSCPVTEDGLFCHLGPKALKELNAIRQTSVYPKGASLFVEGQTADGLFVLCSGKVKLTASHSQGRSIILRVAGPGELLGLSATIAGHVYEVGAETLEPVQVNYLPRATFLQFVEQHGEVAMQIARHASLELRRAYAQVTRIALAPTTRAKLAGLLLEWSETNGEPGTQGVRFHLPLTQQEIGEVIGSSRETVSRAINEFRRKGLIRVNGTAITLQNPSGLKKFLA